MGRGTWSWIVPDGLWEIAKPLIPPSKVRPQGGGTQDTPDETLFAAIIYVLVSGCAWRALPPCFGISKSTAHRRFLIWSRAGVWGRLHEEILHRLDDAGLLDLSQAVLDSAHVRAKKGGELTGPSPVDRGKSGSKMHVLSDANGLPLLVGISAANTHDSQALKPMVLGHPPSHPRRTRTLTSPCEGTAEQITCPVGELSPGQAFEGTIVAELSPGQTEAQIQGKATWKEPAPV